MDSKHSVQSDTEAVVLDIEAGSGDKKPTSFFQSLRSVTFCTFMVVGISILWPWNCFLSATVYFQKYFFRDTTGFAKVFASTTMVTSSVASVAFIVFLARRQRGYARRVSRGTLWQMVVFCALVVLMLVHNKFPIWLSFLLVMLVVFCSVMCTGTTQNGIYALANAFGSEFSQALMIGQAVAGVMPSAFLFIVSVIGGESDEKQKWLALAYFVSSTLIPGLALLLYKFSGIATSFSSEQEAAQKIPYVPFKILFKNLKFLVLSIFTSFAASLVFPVFASNIHASVIPLSLNKFVPLVMTLWNAGDLAGRFVPSLSIFQSRHITPKRIFLVALVRILMIPVFFAFNINGVRKPNAALDIFYMLWQFVFGLTNGAIVTLSFMKVGGCFTTDTERKAATGMVTIFLSTGLTTGSVISYLFGYFCTLVK